MFILISQFYLTQSICIYLNSKVSIIIKLSVVFCRDKENGGRLRNDDEGSDAEEDRIKMTVDVASEDRMRLRAEFTAAQQHNGTFQL